MLKKILLLSFTIVAAFFFVIVNIPTAAADEVQWTDYDTGIERAKEEGKPVMIDFYTDWCGYCKDMDKETFKDDPVAEKSRDFVAIKVDGDDRSDLVNKYSIRGYPTTIFLDKDQNEVHRVVGYVGPDDLEAHMEYALGERAEAPRSDSGLCLSSIMIIAILGGLAVFLIHRRFANK